MKSLVLTAFLWSQFFLPVHAAPIPSDADALSDTLIDLDLESLMAVEVYSASKKTQRLSEISSAVFVINQDMIRRSGLTEIPDILRLAPGVQVSRINGNSWSVSIRGGSGRYGDKLLVMIDGRSIYTLLFAGVYWEDQDLVLADIDRIEVVRGPGAAIWGANAVNGVINIITKAASETQGFHVNVSTGTTNTGLAGMRYGGIINDNAHYRVSLKYRQQVKFDRLDGTENHDGLQVGHGSFRTDWEPNGRDSFSLQGAMFDGTVEENMVEFSPVPPYVGQVREDDDSRGWNLVGSWSRQVSADNQIDLKLYYDDAHRDSFFYFSDLDTFDLALQQQFVVGSRHNVIYGFRYRYTGTEIEGRTNFFVNHGSRSDYLYSFFLQDEIALLEKELFLTLGSKFEYQSFTGFEVQPTARLLWNVNQTSSLWAAVSRAVRNPSIGEQEMSMEGGYIPVEGNPDQLVGFWVLGNPDLDSETLIAYEAGFRSELTSAFSVDFSLFYNQYDDVRGYELLQPVPVLEPVPHLRTGMQMANNVSGHSYGFELSADWKPVNSLRFRANYSNIRIETDDTPGIPDFLNREFAGRVPTSLYNLSMDWSPWPDLDLGMYLYGSSSLSYETDPVPDYIRFDLRLAWRPVTGVELSLVGRNLFDSDHTEYPSADALLNSDIPQSIYAGLTLDF